MTSTPIAAEGLPGIVTLVYSQPIVMAGYSLPHHHCRMRTLLLSNQDHKNSGLSYPCLNQDLSMNLYINHKLRFNPTSLSHQYINHQLPHVMRNFPFYQCQSQSINLAHSFNHNLLYINHPLPHMLAKPHQVIMNPSLLKTLRIVSVPIFLNQ